MFHGHLWSVCKPVRFALGIVATLTDVGYSKRHNFNLLSVTSLWQQGCSTKAGNSEIMSIIGPDRVSTIHFDIVMRTRIGAVYVGCFVHLERVDSAEISGANPSPRLKMSILMAHQIRVNTPCTAKALGITITRGSMPVWKACALSKAKQKNVPKKSMSEPITRPFQRVHTDISQIKVLDEDRDEATLSKALIVDHSGGCCY
jgi:limonene-1,2-epoxide hydrolase